MKSLNVKLAHTSAMMTFRHEGKALIKKMNQDNLNT